MQLNTNQLEFPELVEYDALNKKLKVLHERVMKIAKLEGMSVKQIDVGVWEIRVIRENPEENN
jgi:hypothetical protein